MKPNQYQDWAIRRSFFKSGNIPRLMYFAIGLGGESSELLEKIHVIPAGETSPEDIMYELGDVVWYLATSLEEMAVPLESVSILPIRESLNIATDSVLLQVQVGRFQELVKKLYRDDQGEISPERLRKFLTLASYILGLIVNIADRLGYTLEAVFAMNVEKLESRDRRGVRAGDGDNR